MLCPDSLTMHAQRMIKELDQSWVPSIGYPYFDQMFCFKFDIAAKIKWLLVSGCYSNIVLVLSFLKKR